MNDPSTPTNDEDLFFEVGRREPVPVEIDPSSDLFAVISSERVIALAKWTPAAADDAPRPRHRRRRTVARIRAPFLYVAAITLLVTIGAEAWRYRASNRVAVFPTSGAQPAAESAANIVSAETARLSPPPAPAKMAMTSIDAPPRGGSVRDVPLYPTVARPAAVAANAAAPKAPTAPRAPLATPAPTPLAASALPTDVPTTPSVAQRWSRVTSASDAALALSRLSTQSAASPKVSDEQAVRFAIDRYLRSQSAQQQIDLSDCKIQVTGDVASAGCTGRAPLADRASETSTPSPTWSFDLSRAGRDWQIEKAESR